MTETKDHTPRSETYRFVTLSLVATLLVYTLSIGPMIGFAVHHHSMEPFVETFYAPIMWLYAHTPLRALIQWYVELWIR